MSQPTDSGQKRVAVSANEEFLELFLPTVQLSASQLQFNGPLVELPAPKCQATESSTIDNRQHNQPQQAATSTMTSTSQSLVLPEAGTTLMNQPPVSEAEGRGLHTTPHEAVQPLSLPSFTTDASTLLQQLTQHLFAAAANIPLFQQNNQPTEGQDISLRDDYKALVAEHVKGFGKILHRHVRMHQSIQHMKDQLSKGEVSHALRLKFVSYQSSAYPDVAERVNSICEPEFRKLLLQTHECWLKAKEEEYRRDLERLKAYPEHVQQQLQALRTPQNAQAQYLESIITSLESAPEQQHDKWARAAYHKWVEGTKEAGRRLHSTIEKEAKKRAEKIAKESEAASSTMELLSGGNESISQLVSQELQKQFESKLNTIVEQLFRRLSAHGQSKGSTKSVPVTPEGSRPNTPRRVSWANQPQGPQQQQQQRQQQQQQQQQQPLQQQQQHQQQNWRPQNQQQRQQQWQHHRERGYPPNDQGPPPPFHSQWEQFDNPGIPFRSSYEQWRPVGPPRGGRSATWRGRGYQGRSGWGRGPHRGPPFQEDWAFNYQPQQRPPYWYDPQQPQRSYNQDAAWSTSQVN